MQNWLKLKNEWRSWNDKTLRQITNAFPWPQYNNRDVCIMCLSSMSSLESLLSQGKYAEAKAMQQQTLQLRETVVGKDHPDTLACIISLATSLCLQGKYKEAEAMLWRTLQL